MTPPLTNEIMILAHCTTHNIVHRLIDGKMEEHRDCQFKTIYIEESTPSTEV